MKTATMDASKSDAAVIALAARVVALAEVEQRAFERLRGLEEHFAADQPPMPDVERGEAAFGAWAIDLRLFELESGITDASRLFERTTDRTQAAAVELAALPARSVDALLAKARAAELAGRDRDQIAWVVALKGSLADDVLVLASGS